MCIGQTRFAQNTDLNIDDAIPPAYQPFVQPILATFAHQPTVFTTEANGAKAIWRAANDTTGQLRFPAGPDAVALAR